MKKRFTRQSVFCLSSYFLLVSLANSQAGTAGMNPPINQIEAIESHLQQSRTQSSREAEVAEKKIYKASESGKSVVSAQGAKQKKAEGSSEKAKIPAAASPRKD